MTDTENEALKKRIAELEEENSRLKNRIVNNDTEGLKADTKKVLLHLFKASHINERDVGYMSTVLLMERSLLQYHLDQLKEWDFASLTSGNYVTHQVFWGLTPKGRSYAVENGLL